ncbi:helix-turn-helix domain-containing protein [Streptomyces pseudogriseolus]|uniref:helix-turn-helix domain-containing protein n=1 Tax=Streptomyces pseudogriseolus TaxID=36817 RepID=UPI003FA20FC8
MLEGAFALLEALRQHGDEAGVTELAVACGVPKSTAHRLLEQLVALGAVERRGARYRLGAQLYRLGQAGSRTQDCAWRDACRCTG